MHTSTEISTGFTDGKLSPFYICTTYPQNYPFATTLNGQPCVNFTWHQAGYNGTRTGRGTEMCNDLRVQKEGWYGFYYYLPDPGYPMDKVAGCAQFFASSSRCNSWAGMLTMRNNDMWISHRSACVTPTESLIYANFPRNRWVSVITHFVVSHLHAGVFEIWIDGVLKYSATGINFGYDTWDSNDGLVAPNAITFKIGQYDYDDGHYTPGEVRTSYYTNVTQLSGNPSGVFDYIRSPVAGVSAPAAPTGLRATAGNSQVLLSWTPSPGADSYNLKRATVSGGPYILLASSNATSFTDTGLVNGTSYYYVASAVNKGGESANSSEASATPSNPVSFPFIQAANYTSMSGVKLETCSDTGGGQDVAYIHSGAYTSYNSVNVSGATAIDFRVASNSAGGTIEVRVGSVTGTLLGTAQVTNTGGWGTWSTKQISLATRVTGTQNIYLVYKGSSSGFLFNVHWFQFR